MKKIISLILLLLLMLVILFQTHIYANSDIESNDSNFQSEENRVSITNVETRETSRYELSSNIYSRESNDLIITDEYICTKGYIPDNIESTYNQMEISPNSIIGGSDGRTPVSEYSKTRYPYIAIGYVESTWSDGSVSRGTGALIGDNIVLTAGHNIFDAVSDERLGFATNVRFIPGKYSNSGTGKEPFGYSDTDYYLTVDEYTNSINGNSIPTTQARCDWGLLILHDNIGEKTSWFQMKNYKNADALLGLGVTVTGYPSSINSVERFNLWQMAGNIKVVADSYIGYEIDTSSGQSGAPVHDLDNYIVGVHNLSSVPGSAEFRHNYAARMNSNMFVTCYDIIVNY